MHHSHVRRRMRWGIGAGTASSVSVAAVTACLERPTQPHNGQQPYSLPPEPPANQSIQRAGPQHPTTHRPPQPVPSSVPPSVLSSVPSSLPSCSPRPAAPAPWPTPSQCPARRQAAARAAAAAAAARGGRGWRGGAVRQYTARRQRSRGGTAAAARPPRRRRRRGAGPGAVWRGSGARAGGPRPRPQGLWGIRVRVLVCMRFVMFMMAVQLMSI